MLRVFQWIHWCPSIHCPVKRIILFVVPGRVFSSLTSAMWLYELVSSLLTVWGWMMVRCSILILVWFVFVYLVSQCVSILPINCYIVKLAKLDTVYPTQPVQVRHTQGNRWDNVYGKVVLYNIRHLSKFDGFR